MLRQQLSVPRLKGAKAGFRSGTLPLGLSLRDAVACSCCAVGPSTGQEVLLASAARRAGAAMTRDGAGRGRGRASRA